jgi:hypothetical protein
MQDAYEIIELEDGWTVEIDQDEYPDDPRKEWDQAGPMFASYLVALRANPRHVPYRIKAQLLKEGIRI